MLSGKSIFFKKNFTLSIVVLCLTSLFRNRKVFFFFNFLCYSLFFTVQLLCLEIDFFFQFLMLFIVFLWLGSLFIEVEKSFFFFQFLMLFIVFPCLSSLFRNREAFFFSFPCNLLFFSIQVCCLEIKESLFKNSFVIYCFSLFSFAVYKQRSVFFFQFLMFFIVFLCLGFLFRNREVLFLYIYIYIYIMLSIVFLCWLLCLEIEKVFFFLQFLCFYWFSLAFLFGNKEDFSFSGFYVFFICLFFFLFRLFVQ